MRRRAVSAAVLALPLSLACADDDDAGDAVPKCVPGQQVSCACPGSEPGGVQVCQQNGTYSTCLNCPGGNSVWPSGPDAGVSGSGGSGGSGGAAGSGASGGSGNTGPCANHCSNGVTDCGEQNVDCGGDCPPTAQYTWCDCLFDTPRNGSEICDDSGFVVPANPPPGVLVCLEPAGGVIYTSTNTAIDPTDGKPRCSGWELNGQNPWDHLDYIAQLTCDAAQKTTDVDVSAYVGQTLWFGAHDNPSGGGKGTTACIAIKK